MDFFAELATYIGTTASGVFAFKKHQEYHHNVAKFHSPFKGQTDDLFISGVVYTPDNKPVYVKKYLGMA